MKERLSQLEKTGKVNRAIIEVIKLGRVMSKTNSLMGLVIYLYMIIFCIVTTSCLYMAIFLVSSESPNYLGFFNYIALSFICHLDVFWICNTSQTLINSMDSICDAFEVRLCDERESKGLLLIDNQIRLDLMKSLRKRIEIRGLNLYVISRRTYFSLLHMTITFSIILVQTN